jgi:hypothetical protein
MSNESEIISSFQFEFYITFNIYIWSPKKDSHIILFIYENRSKLLLPARKLHSGVECSPL